MTLDFVPDRQAALPRSFARFLHSILTAPRATSDDLLCQADCLEKLASFEAEFAGAQPHELIRGAAVLRELAPALAAVPLPQAAAS